MDLSLSFINSFFGGPSMKWKVVPLLAPLLLLFLVSPALAGVPNGSPAPNFRLPDVNNVDHSLRDFLGKVVLLNFWQST